MSRYAMRVTVMPATTGLIELDFCPQVPMRFDSIVVPDGADVREVRAWDRWLVAVPHELTETDRERLEMGEIRRYQRYSVEPAITVPPGARILIVVMVPELPFWGAWVVGDRLR